MAYQTLPGLPYANSPPFWLSLAPTFINSTAIAATGDKLALIGRYWNPARATKSIQRICTLFGAVTKAGGSAMTLSLQDVDLANGPTIRPDETQDQTVAVANADATFATNTWHRSGTLSADRSINPGELIAVVLEYDGSGRLGADSVTLRGLTTAGATQAYKSTASKISGTWASVATTQPNVVFEHSDGTFGFLLDCWPVSAINTHSFKQDTAGADEYATEFTVPAKFKIDSLWMPVNLAGSNSNFSLVLYTGTTATETVTVDAHATRSAAGTPTLIHVPTSQLIELVPGTTYRIAAKPTQTTSNISAYSLDVADANHFGGYPGGPDWTYTNRLDLGSFAAATTTRRLLAGFGVAAWDDGAGGSSVVAVIGE